MSIENITSQLGDNAKDIKLNLATVLEEELGSELTRKQRYAIALACVYAKNDEALIKAFEAASVSDFNQMELDAIKASAIIMSMNNVYYRFVHLVSDEEYSKLPAKLRMNVLMSPNMNKIDFELCSLAVSALNGCGMCMDAHAATLSKAGLGKVTIQGAVRIAAVINALTVAFHL